MHPLPIRPFDKPEVVADSERFLENGGVIPDELTCRRCHRDENFAFDNWWPKIKHSNS
jgi:hypothetical protein